MAANAAGFSGELLFGASVAGEHCFVFTPSDFVHGLLVVDPAEKAAATMLPESIPAK